MPNKCLQCGKELTDHVFCNLSCTLMFGAKPVDELWNKLECVRCEWDRCQASGDPASLNWLGNAEDKIHELLIKKLDGGDETLHRVLRKTDGLRCTSRRTGEICQVALP